MKPKPWLLGIAGDPVKHSLSPRIHNAALKHLQLPYEYKTFPCPDAKALRQLIKTAPALRLRGLNITTPLKEAAARILIAAGEADDEVLRTLSANTLVIKDRVTGGSTDGKGGLRYLRHLGLKSKNRLLILGAGATAGNLLWHLVRSGWKEIGIVTRRPTAVRNWIRRWDCGDISRLRMLKSETLDRESDLWDALVSTWPPGIVSHDLLCSLLNRLQPGAPVIDLNYGSGRDWLAKAAGRAGYPAYDGKGFLLHQALLSFKMWTRKSPPVDIMRKASGLKIIP